MAMSLKYRGTFMDVCGVAWKVEIYKKSESDQSQGTVLMSDNLTFDADSPLVIEWGSIERYECLWGSTATLKVISLTDREFTDLYSIKPGSIRMDVYRSTSRRGPNFVFKLYWSGCLDPEFYEEPYERLDNYTVTLTFSDFGILDRIRYKLTGMQNLSDIVDYALEKTGITYGSIDRSMITTTFPDGESITGGGLSVRSDNFIDEDGKASTIKDALEGILQPLAVRIAQRGGIIYLYDLNGLHAKETANEIEWDGSTQKMSTGKVANNVIVTYSPYSSSKIVDSDDLKYTGKYDADHYNFLSETMTFDEGY